jgi:hypothetical protein
MVDSFVGLQCWTLELVCLRSGNHFHHQGMVLLPHQLCLLLARRGMLLYHPGVLNSHGAHCHNDCAGMPAPLYHTVFRTE